MKQVLPRFRSPTRFLSCDLATAAARLARFDGTAFSDEDEPALSQDCERFRARVPPPLLLQALAVLIKGNVKKRHITRWGDDFLTRTEI